MLESKEKKHLIYKKASLVSLKRASLRLMIHLKKNAKESNEKLVQRFQKKVQGSRILLQAKERMYFKKPMKKRQIRKKAMMREKYRAEREKKKYL